MNTMRLQGWALLLILPLDLLFLVGGNVPLLATFAFITVVLFILGAPAIWSSQSLGAVGLIGLIGIELAAVIALSLNYLGGSGMSDALPLISVLAGAVGRIILGWLTTQRKLFPAWVGWAFFMQGLLSLAGYFFLYELASVGPLLGTVAFWLDDLALFGYGLGITRQK